MYQDIIQNFLNLPEVVGIALMQGRVIPYFYVDEKIINPEGRVLLIRNLRKNILETPELSNSSEFKVDEYYAYPVKLNDTLTLLAISNKRSLIVQSMISKILKSNLQENVNETIKLFESLTTKTIRNSKSENNVWLELNTDKLSETSQVSEEVYSVHELVVTLNELSQFVSNYLGPKLTSNFWNLTRPNRKWLDNFQIRSSARIDFTSSLEISVTPLQHLFIREWTNAFMNQCSQIIRDLPSRIDKEFLVEKQRKMISIMPYGYLNEIGNLSTEDQRLFE